MCSQNLQSSLAQFCDENGVTMLGSDSLIYIDGRWNAISRDIHASSKRETFRKHFPSKYASMTHYVYRGQIRIVS